MGVMTNDDTVGKKNLKASSRTKCMWVGFQVSVN